MQPSISVATVMVVNNIIDNLTMCVAQISLLPTVHAQ